MFFRKNLFDYNLWANPDDFYWKYNEGNHRNLPDTLNSLRRCYKYYLHNTDQEDMHHNLPDMLNSLRRCYKYYLHNTDQEDIYHNRPDNCYMFLPHHMFHLDK
ncbi:MAG TPA: hypothetical protein PLV27_04855 [Anaerolineaceae bacterium]|nr:hypothetical protein [Anaerolineaceae bacterium]